MLVTAADATSAPPRRPVDMGVAADGPIEADGGRRSDVRLLVATADHLSHRRFHQLPDVLIPGDVLVVNTSATVPAAVSVEGDTDRLVHLSGRQSDGSWLVELRRVCRRGSQPAVDEPGPVIPLAGSAHLRLRERFRSRNGPSPRLWRADLRGPWSSRRHDEPTASALRWSGARGLDPAVSRWLHDVGRPIRYGCPSTSWPLSAYQTVFATSQGSAEMPSAGRPFTDALLTRLRTGGVEFAPITLHTGISSQEKGEDPYPEWFSVPSGTAARINRARAAGRRVIAVGTTAVRALESAVHAGRVQARRGWTDLVVTPERGVRAIDGLITGWHEPEASHLDMLVAVAGFPLVEASYAAAARRGYRWHEFGDSHLLLPG